MYEDALSPTNTNAKYLSKIEKISISEFGRRLNVSEGAVRRAIKRGDIGKAYDPIEKKIIYNQAKDCAWALQQAIIKPKGGISRSKAAEKINKAEEKKSSLEKKFPIPPVELEDDLVLNGTTEDLLKSIKIHGKLKTAESFRQREIIALALDKKKLEETEGILVRRDKVEKALFTVGSELKKALFTMPQRIIRDIMAAPNEVEAINIMNDELTIILNTYGNLKSNSLS